MKTRISILKVLTALLAVAALSFTCCNCEIWFGDDTSDDPVFHGTTFTLQLRMPTDESVKEENDGFSHSTTDGELICEWEIPTYGNTVYESVKKFFEDRTDKIYFRAEQHTFYMFSKCVLESGEEYNLETAYVAADGIYSKCANRQSVLGADGIAGTDDDLKVLVIVYKGWLY